MVRTHTARETITGISPAAHGGHMHTPETRAGATAYFAVYVPGAPPTVERQRALLPFDQLDARRASLAAG